MRCCTLNPRLSRCVRTTLPAARKGLPQEDVSVTTIRFEKQTRRSCSAVTIGVVGVDVGIGGVPALYGPVNPSTETLLPGAAHHHAQYSPPVGQNTEDTSELFIKPTLKERLDLLVDSFYLWALKV